jgi:N-acetylglucosamine-6-phosphate deacetylase
MRARHHLAAGHHDDGADERPRAAFRALSAHLAPAAAALARVMGVHLEGPYINPGKLGAQPDFARPVRPTRCAACTPWRRSA